MLESLIQYISSHLSLAAVPVSHWLICLAFCVFAFVFMFAFNWQTGLESHREDNGARRGIPDCGTCPAPFRSQTGLRYAWPRQILCVCKQFVIGAALLLCPVLQRPAPMDTFVILKYFVDFAGEDSPRSLAFEVFIWLKAETAHTSQAHFSSLSFARLLSQLFLSDTLIVLHSPFGIGLTWRMSDLILNYGLWFISHSQSVMDLRCPVLLSLVLFAWLPKLAGRNVNRKAEAIAAHLPDDTALCQEK